MFDGITVFMAATGLVAAIVIVAAVFVLGDGRGGQLSTEHADHTPLRLPDRRPLGGTDAALLRLPLGLWGYHQQITDEAMWRFAQALTERDTRIAVLEQQLAEVRKNLDARSVEKRTRETGEAFEEPDGKKPAGERPIFEVRTNADEDDRS